MSSVLIWGTGNTAQVFLNRIDCNCNIVRAFVDNDSKKWGGYTSFLPSIPIISPEMIKNIAYDILIICSVYHEEIMKQCKEMKLENVFSYQNFNLFKKYPLLESKTIVKNNNEEIWNQCNLLTIGQIVQPVIESFENYYNTTLLKEDTSDAGNYIWSCWWQGEENAPVLVKKCFESIKSKIVNQDIFMVVITKNNWMEYIEIPNYILEKVDTGIISYTHLSDIIRIKLLRKFGGLWLDATIYCPYKFDKDILQKPFYSLKEGGNVYDDHIMEIRHLYKSFFIEARKSNILLEFLDRAQMYYWKNRDSLLVYLLLDYMTRIAYDSFSEIEKMIEEVPINNIEIETLGTKMNEPFDEKEWKRINKNTYFFKLSNRREYKEYDMNGQMTFYGCFIRGLI